MAVKKDIKFIDKELKGTISLEIILDTKEKSGIFNIDLLAGRWLRPLIEGDTIVEFVVNKALIDKIGFPDPNEALGKIITCSSFTGEIVGITEVFNVEDLKDEVLKIAAEYKKQNIPSIVLTTLEPGGLINDVAVRLNAPIKKLSDVIS